MPVELGLSRIGMIYGKRLVVLLLVAAANGLLVGLYVFIHKFGLTGVFLLLALIGLICISALASTRDAIARSYFGRLPQTMRYEVERVFALIILTIFWPYLVLIPVLIWLDSPGTIFHTEIRVGRYGRLFRMRKYRTVHASSSTRLSRKRFSVLRLLRSTGVDRFPTLFNVVRGDMTLFGAKPLTPEELLVGPIFLSRLVTKPGLAPIPLGHDPWAAPTAAFVERWLELAKALQSSGIVGGQRLVLIRISAGVFADRKNEPIVLPFFVEDGDEEILLSKLGLRHQDASVITGDAPASASLIQAAWTAWYDLAAAG